MSRPISLLEEKKLLVYLFNRMNKDIDRKSIAVTDYIDHSLTYKENKTLLEGELSPYLTITYTQDSPFKALQLEKARHNYGAVKRALKWAHRHNKPLNDAALRGADFIY